MTSLESIDPMEEDFTGFDEEPIGVVVNPSGATIIDGDTNSRIEDPVNETDSDSGNLVIAEPEKKQAVTAKSAESKSPRKRRSKVEDITPTRAPSSRVRGQGLAYLLAMEKGGSKKQLAKAQAQVDAQDSSTNLVGTSNENPPLPLENSLQDAELPTNSESEPEKKKNMASKEKETGKPLKEKEQMNKVLMAKDKEVNILANEDGIIQDIPSSLDSSSAPLPAAIKPTNKTGARKSFSAVNISSPLLKEPFKEGWRREVVYRATVDPGNARTLCDVYYYAPDGKKLRSGREVADYLDKTGGLLSTENFTFFKEPIGMDSSLEILRYAKTNRRDEGTTGEKQITKKEKALKAREEELRRNLQELGEDVAAITGHSPGHEAGASAGGSVNATPESCSPLNKRKRGNKVEKQLKIKLWGKGLKSKENAEPLKKEDTTEGEEDPEIVASNTSDKISSIQNVPDDISHLFTPHAGSSSPKQSNKPFPRGQKSIVGNTNDTCSAGQHLVLINGKRFISVGPGTDLTRNSSQDEFSNSNKRALSSTGTNSHRQSPKRTKLSQSSPIAVQYSPRITTGGFGFPTEQFNNFVSYAYYGLLHVFRYLTVQELMAAAGVCKLWRDLALHHSHWRLVRLKNSRIYDWSSFASHLRRAGTQHLDMRKMLFVTSAEETWANLERASSNLSEIQRIDLCKCPAEVLHSIAKHCFRLKSIDAQFISSSNISLEPLTNLKRLEELKIRSVAGMTLTDGLLALAQLTQLKTLNLTTITDLKSSELVHLMGLQHLESFELGDCSHWVEESDYQSLGELQQLRHLRLEQGPIPCVLQHLENALGRMPNLQHVELVNFTMSTPMDILKSQTGLKRLLIIPRYSAETLVATVRHLFDRVVLMQHLQQLSWVVTDEVLSTLVDGKLPLERAEDASPTEGGGGASVDELEQLLRQRLPLTSVHLFRLPEYASNRYSLSVVQED